MPLRDIIDLVLQGRPAAISFGAANPRHAHEWTVFEDAALAAGKVLVPGVLGYHDQLHRAPGAGRAADRPLREARRARERHGGHRLRLPSFAASENVDPSIVWAKLHAMADGAEIASRELY